jgi:integrase
MATYSKKLKRGKGGVIVRYIGQNQKGVPEKFRLGYDLAEAERRVELITALWAEMESKRTVNEEVVRRLMKPFWEPAYLDAAKAIAKGKPPTLPKNGCYETPESYLRRIGTISASTGTKFEPADPNDLESAISVIQQDIPKARNTLSLAINVPTATGRTLREAFDAYEVQTKRDNTNSNGLSAWGKTKLDQIHSIRSYLGDERFGGQDLLALDLAELTYQRCGEIYGVFRCRPLTLRTNLQRRMTPASAKNLIKELGNFFDWLDGAEEFEWTEPRRFRSIVKTPEKLTPEEQYERRQAKKKSVIPTEHIQTLLEYALPIERILLLLGLNCAFGAAEVGQLRTGFLRLDEAVIDGVRFKTGNETKHRLWSQTIAGLRWVLERRQRQTPLRPEYQDIVFLSDRGKPLWHHTPDGNTSNGVGNIWYRLIQRVQNDDKEFPSYSFNKLRKTAATRILNIANAETASMILAHNTISDDELLENYAVLPWEKLFLAQEQFGAELADVLAGDPQQWETKRKTYIGLKKQKRIVELHESNMPAPEIATLMGVNIATVYRVLQTRYGKRRPGRKPASKRLGDDPKPGNPKQPPA